MTVQKPDPRVLRQADKAELLHRPTSDDAQRLAQDLLGITLAGEETHLGPRKKRRRPSATESLRSTISALVHDLMEAGLNVEAEGRCFRSERIPEFTDTVATFTQYMIVRDVWIAEGLMERVEGAWWATSWEGGGFVQTTGRRAGWSPRLRATPKLMGIAESHGITPENIGDHFTATHERTYPVTLTTKEKEDGGGKDWNMKKPSRRVPFDHTEESDRIAEEVRVLNAFLEGQTYQPPIQPRYVCRFSEDSKRPGQLVHGGRLYAVGKDNFQSWDPDRRLGLTINGLPVAEIDIKASHLTIYLARHGVRLPQGGDPDVIRDLPRLRTRKGNEDAKAEVELDRLVVKGLVTAFFGRGDLGQVKWPRKLKSTYLETYGRDIAEDYKLKDVKAHIEEAIPLLRRLREGGLTWGELQKIEARILLGVMTPLRTFAGTPILTVHDSLIVPEPHVEHAAWALSTRFQGETGTYPTLMIRRFGQKEVRWRDPRKEDGGDAT